MNKMFAIRVSREKHTRVGNRGGRRDKGGDVHRGIVHFVPCLRGRGGFGSSGIRLV